MSAALSAPPAAALADSRVVEALGAGAHAYAGGAAARGAAGAEVLAADEPGGGTSAHIAAFEGLWLTRRHGDRLLRAKLAELAQLPDYAPAARPPPSAKARSTPPGGGLQRRGAGAR